MDVQPDGNLPVDVENPEVGDPGLEEDPERKDMQFKCLDEVLTLESRRRR